MFKKVFWGLESDNEKELLFQKKSFNSFIVVCWFGDILQKITLIFQGNMMNMGKLEGDYQLVQGFEKFKQFR